MKTNLCRIFLFLGLICFAGYSEASTEDIQRQDNLQNNLQDNLQDNVKKELTEDEIQEYFNNGYEFFEKEKYLEAAQNFYKYMSLTSPDEVNYEWASFFLGISFKKRGLSHAAVEVLSHIVTRKPNPKIVSYSLELLELVTRTLPFDHDLIINQVVCDKQYGFVGKDLENFLNYYQGEYDWEHGFFEWGNEHFAGIVPETYYYYKYLFKKALYRVYQGRVDDAVSILKQILESPDIADDLQDNAHAMLARLLYEKGEFSNAYMQYEQIKKPILEQAEYLLERAWAEYRQGHTEKAMGLLYAFGAPSFENYFTPEYFILKSIIYKDVCHYRRAMNVVNEFKEHYKNALDVIYNRGTALENPALIMLVLGKKEINRIWNFIELLDKEKKKTGLFQDKALVKYLDQIYAMQIQESVESIRLLIEKEYEKYADMLLTFEEEADLIEYEIGLDMYERASQYHYTENNSLDKNLEGLPNKVVYIFQGEYWNDELAQYKVSLPEKCSSTEEWDIFFK